MLGTFVRLLLTADINGDVPGLDALIECLLKAGIIVDRGPPPIADNGLVGSANVECTGDPMCARIT
jgi:hypothetical protein